MATDDVKRQPANWAAIRAAYEANRLSTRAIARQNDVSHTAIQKRAAAEGWERQPWPAEISRQRENVPGVGKLAAAKGNAAMRNCRGTVTIADRGRDLAIRLLDELDAATSHLGEIEQAIVDETAGDADGRRRQSMLRAVDLQRRATILKDIASAARTLADSELGKKEQATAAAGRAASGRYATPATPPKLVVDNGDKR